MPLIDMGWLREHVSVPENETYAQLAADLVKVGLEEEAVHEGDVTGPIVVGYVEDLVREPQKNGKTISWCHIDVGPYNVQDGEGNTVPRSIVCGAPNIAQGEKVAVALPGAVLPGGFRIEPRKTYGHMSEGMCASARELGISDDHEGIILLRSCGLSDSQYKALKPGDDLMGLFGLGEPVLEINITPDRGYAFSYRGVAREFHHSTGAEFTDPVEALDGAAPAVSHNPGSARDIEVIISDSQPIHGVQGCDRYYARAVRGIDNTVKTPRWLAHRLQRSGMRSLSPVVDATNYAMLDLGQPLHAYDLGKIIPPIVVRRAREGEQLTTLDGKDHNLSPEDLLITDSPDGAQGSRILGIAGVMGGMYGEVTEETTNILIESAHFDPVSIARSARRHKIPSEASRRFERGVDTKLQPAAAEEAAQLIVKICGGQVSDTPADYDQTVEMPSIRFKTSEVKRLTALDISVSRISEILT
ncbi:MAG: phenylalanine--tRNA ligase subunit beta, partial [Scardovia wiggsiae]